jgi:hypothetical protein
LGFDFQAAFWSPETGRCRSFCRTRCNLKSSSSQRTRVRVR